MVVVVIGVAVGAAFGVAGGDFACVGRGAVSCAKTPEAIRTEKIMAGRIIDRLQHASERYQSSMKSIFASLIVAFLAVSATAKVVLILAAVTLPVAALAQTSALSTRNTLDDRGPRIAGTPPPCAIYS